MAAPGTLAYRLKGIPASHDRKSVQHLACQLLGLHEAKVRVRSLAQHPLRHNEKMATLSLLEAPGILTGGPLSNQWSLTEPDQDLEGVSAGYSLDTHFHGLTPLHDCPDNECDADLVAVSGLNGHAFGSFKARGTDFMWIRDALPRNLPNCRLFVYGYDTTMVQSASRQSILDLGSRFASALRDLARAARRARLPKRSLVLVGHSLGGLLVQQGIVELSDSHPCPGTQDDKTIVQSIGGILLFGVPQRGMSVEALITMVKDQPNRDLVSSLSVDSAFLQLQHESFCRARSNMDKFAITSYFETQETPTVIDVSGRWQMTGKSTLLVSKTSAASPGDMAIAINRNHSDMVKFHPHDEDYDRVVSELEYVLKDLPCFEPTTTPTTSGPSEAGIKALHSLGFDQQHWRRDEIDPGDKTCDWLVEHESFQKWFQSHDHATDRLIWIRGHPGSGKSTLMKYALSHIEQHGPENQIVVSFFFHGRGASLQKTKLGFLRSVLHQLLSDSPDCLRPFQKAHARKSMTPRKSDVQWTEGELQSFVKRYLRAASATKPICLLVDALDEAGKETAEDLVRLFRTISAHPNLHIIFSCRHYPVLAEVGRLTISMEKENKDDIAKIVGSELCEEFHEEEAKILESQIIEKANGMFQWATLVTRSIVEARREMGRSMILLQLEIQKLPPDLFELYDSLLGKKDAAEKAQTLKLMRWLIFAIEPLDIHELQHALVVDVESVFRSTSEFETSPNYTVNVEKTIKTLGKGLVEIQQHGGRQIAQFIHQSVLDFLLDGGGLQKLDQSADNDAVVGNAYFQLSRSCIRYLLLEDIDESFNSAYQMETGCKDDVYAQIFPQIFTTFALYRHSSAFWIVYTMQVESCGIDQKDLLDIIPWRHGDHTVPLPFVARTSVYLYDNLGRSGDKHEEFDMHTTVCEAHFKLKKMSLGRITAFDKIYERLVNCEEYLDPNSEFVFDVQHSFLWRWLENNRKFFNILALAGICTAWKSMLAETRACGRHIFNKSDVDNDHPLLNLVLGNPDIEPGDIPKTLIDLFVNEDDYISPLFAAIVLQRDNLANAFINAGAQLNYSGSDGVDGKMPIYKLAILCGNDGIFRSLIEANGGNFVSQDDSALHFAARHGKESMVRVLLEYCMPLHSPENFLDRRRGENGPTAMEDAADSGESSICRLLAEQGADQIASSSGVSSLCDAVREKRLHEIKLLLEIGVNPNIRSSSARYSPFQIAMDMCDTEVLNVLLQDDGIDPNLVDDEKQTELMRLILHPRKDGSDVLRVLEECISSGKFNFDLRDWAGESLLSKMVVQSTHSPKLIRILLSEGKANPNTQDNSGCTPLMKAVINGPSNLVELLLSCANTDTEVQDNNGSTALDHAVRLKQTDCANLILNSPNTNLDASRTCLASFCFMTLDNEASFPHFLYSLQPQDFIATVISDVYARARREGSVGVIRGLEAAGVITAHKRLRVS